MEDLVYEIAQELRNRYFGKHRGFVNDNADPQQRGRLRLTVPSVLGETVTDWALPCLPFGGAADQGLFMVPEVDSQVWVEFEEGDLSSPIWTGVFWQKQGDPPAQAALEQPTTRMLKTPSGHLLQFDDAEDEERIHLAHPSGSDMELDAAGSLRFQNSKGASISLDAEAEELIIQDGAGNTFTMSSNGTSLEDANGNSMEMGPSGITVKAQKIVLDGSQVVLGGQGGEAVIKGQSFLSLFMTHVHPTGVGPSGPPVPQGEMSTLSSKVQTA